MNNRTKTLEAEYKPELAITVYRSEDEHYYLESHQVSEEGKIMEGKPLLQETIQEIVDIFFQEKKDRSIISGLVPENLLEYKPIPGGHYRLVWYNPSEIRTLHFAKQLKLTTGKMWVPAILYVVNRDNLAVYALKQVGRPNSKTKLYRAPFHNVSDSGDVCLGSAKVNRPQEKTFASMIKYWEDLFWLSEFSHLNGASNPTKSPIAKVYGKLLASKCKKKWSDLDELKETKKSMKSILQ